MLLKVLLPIYQGQIILICYFQCSALLSAVDESTAIADSFSEKYQKNDSTNNLLHEINVLDQSINDNNFVEVENLSPSVVYQALQSLKNMKNDNVFTFKSDALIHGADILVKYFTLLFQSFLIHGYVPSILSTSTLQPIIKDKLGNKSFLTTNECSFPSTFIY